MKISFVSHARTPQIGIGVSADEKRAQATGSRRPGALSWEDCHSPEEVRQEFSRTNRTVGCPAPCETTAVRLTEKRSAAQAENASLLSSESALIPF
tara:strand:- start:60 stop:347 length:288 start_codon:yes stop_codon:yes gene_type:complete